MPSGRRAFVASLAAFAVACASPTLPLPPPDSPQLTAGGQPGIVHLHGNAGSAEPGALVLVINDNAGLTDRGVVSEVAPDGSWDADIAAVNGDVLTITQGFGKTSSTPLKVTVKLP